MRYANVEGIKSEAQPKTKGTCRFCGTETISKCGQHVIWHWAHKSLAQCDQWWETETEWHRDWKNRFPLDWQETILIDPGTGEKHIADVRTAHGVVVEFQRSTIEPTEVSARELFYKRMVWVIDGMKNDFDRFNFSNMRSSTDGKGIAHFEWFGRSKLFHRWHTKTPTFIDFGREHGFWRICAFNPTSKQGIAMLVNRDLFTDNLISGRTDFSSGGGPAS